MSKRAYDSVMEELKGRIKGIQSKRMRPPAQDPKNGGEHEEPDGDEGPDGEEPDEPEEARFGHGLKAIEADLSGNPDDRMEGLEPDENRMKDAKESDDSTCNGCGAPGDSDDRFCRHCGSQRG